MYAIYSSSTLIIAFSSDIKSTIYLSQWAGSDRENGKLSGNSLSTLAEENYQWANAKSWYFLVGTNWEV